MVSGPENTGKDGFFFPMVSGPETHGTNGLVWQPLDAMVFQWSPMVANHWSNDGNGNDPSIKSKVGYNIAQN